MADLAALGVTPAAVLGTIAASLDLAENGERVTPSGLHPWDTHHPVPNDRAGTIGCADPPTCEPIRWVTPVRRLFTPGLDFVGA